MTKKKIILIILATVLVIFVALVMLGALTHKDEDNSFPLDNLKTFRVENKNKSTYITSKKYGLRFLLPDKWVVKKIEDEQLGDFRFFIHSPNYKVGEFGKKLSGCTLSIQLTTDRSYREELREKYDLLKSKKDLIKTIKIKNSDKELNIEEKLISISGKNSYERIVRFPDGYYLNGAWETIDWEIPLLKKKTIIVGAFLVSKSCKNEIDNFIENIAIKD